MLNELLQGAAKMIPGYMEGQQQAVRDNWNDLNQSNQVRAGQLGNLFNEATFNNRVQRDFNQTAMSNFDLDSRSMMHDAEEVNYPAIINQALANVDGSYYLPWMKNDAAAFQYNQGMQMGQYALQNMAQQSALAQMYMNYFKQNPAAFASLLGGLGGLGGLGTYPTTPMQ